jgi:hypothetical protein
MNPTAATANSGGTHRRKIVTTTATKIVWKKTKVGFASDNLRSAPLADGKVAGSPRFTIYSIRKNGACYLTDAVQGEGYPGYATGMPSVKRAKEYAEGWLRQDSEYDRGRKAADWSYGPDGSKS